MAMNVDVIGKFYLGNGGLGDALIFLSTFYDDVEEANVIFLANEEKSIRELFSLFPKLKKVLVLQNTWKRLKDLYYHPNCIGKGILPKDLDYGKWEKVDIFKEYGVKEFPKFTELFEARKIKPNSFQVWIQETGSSVEGPEKQRRLPELFLTVLKTFLEEYSRKKGIEINFVSNLKLYESATPLKTILETIKGSDLVISVDSFSKTFSCMCGIKSIVHDNIYDPSYLNGFTNRVDAGHYVFIFPWSSIFFKASTNEHFDAYHDFGRGKIFNTSDFLG